MKSSLLTAKIPSHCAGSEDYIGYAWAAEPPFAKFPKPFLVKRHADRWKCHTSVCRFQIADHVPFLERFEGFIEKYKGDIWDGGNQCLYAATPYWYQMANTDDEYPAVRPEDLMLFDAE